MVSGEYMYHVPIVHPEAYEVPIVRDTPRQAVVWVGWGLEGRDETGRAGHDKTKWSG